MNISNLMEQLKLDSVKEGTPTVESEKEEIATKLRQQRYSILSKHMVTHSKKPLSKLASAFVEAEGKNDDCTFCSLYDASKCCLHNEDSGKGLRLVYRDAVERGMSLDYEGLVFKAAPSKISGRFVLFVDGEVGAIKSK